MPKMKQPRRMLGSDNPSAHLAKRVGWSSMEQLIAWFAEQAGAPEDMRDSPSYMIDAVLDHEAPSGREDPVARAKRRDSVKSKVGNWRKARVVGWDSWPQIVELTGIPIALLDAAARKAKREDWTPVDGWHIPGPPDIPTKKPSGLKKIVDDLAAHQRDVNPRLVRKANDQRNPADNSQLADSDSGDKLGAKRGIKRVRG